MWKKELKDEQLWIFDDFCSKAERINALKAHYVPVNHNGLMYHGISRQEDPVSIEALEEILGQTFQKHTVFYRRYLKSEDSETYIHNDCLIGKYTGLLYLNEEGDCQGGTAFWKNKEFGWERQPYDFELKEAGLNDTPELWQKIYHDGFDESKWERTELIEMKPNRLLLFPSVFFHSRYPKKAFGKDIDTARLIKVFFLL